MKSIVTNARITLIRFGKSCPFLLCFIVLISDIENIYAILTHNVVYCNDTLIYDTPISFAIGANFEYDILFIAVIAIISISIEACIYNICSVLYLFLLLLRNHYLFNSEPLSDIAYLAIMILCSVISILFIYKGIQRLK